MGVSREEVRRIAELARLRPDEASVERWTEELNGILEHVRRLDEVDVSDLPDEGSLALAEPAFRDPTLDRDPLAHGAPATLAPEWRDGFFVVPRLPGLESGGDGAEGGSA